MSSPIDPKRPSGGPTPPPEPRLPNHGPTPPVHAVGGIAAKSGAVGLAKLGGIAAALAVAVTVAVIAPTFIAPTPVDDLADVEALEPDAPPADLDGPDMPSGWPGAEAPIGDPSPIDPGPGLPPAPVFPPPGTPAPGTPTPGPDGAQSAPAPAPQPTLDAPTFDADTLDGLVDPILTGTAVPDATVTVFADGRMWFATANSAGEWEAALGDLPAGTTLITAAQVAPGGEFSAAGAPVQVELVPATAQATLYLGYLQYSQAIQLDIEFSGVPGAEFAVTVPDDDDDFAWQWYGTPAFELDGRGSAHGSARLTLQQPSALEPGRLRAALDSITVRHIEGVRTGPTTPATPRFDMYQYVGSVNSGDGRFDPIVTGGISELPQLQSDGSWAEWTPRIIATAGDRTWDAPITPIDHYHAEWSLTLDGLPAGTTEVGFMVQLIGIDSTSRTHTIELEPPTGRLHSPASGELELLLQGRDGASVELLGLGAPIHFDLGDSGQLVLPANSEWLDLPIAVRYASDGRTGPTAPVILAPLPPTFTAETAGGLAIPVLTGTAEPLAGIRVTAEGHEWRTTADQDGNWMLTTDGLSAGAVRLAARQSNAEGAESGASRHDVELLAPGGYMRYRIGINYLYINVTGAPNSTVEAVGAGRALWQRQLPAEGTWSMLAYNNSWNTPEIANTMNELRSYAISGQLEFRYVTGDRVGATFRIPLTLEYSGAYSADSGDVVLEVDGVSADESAVPAPALLEPGDIAFPPAAVDPDAAAVSSPDALPGAARPDDPEAEHRPDAD